MVDSGHVAPRNDRFCTTTWSREWNHVFGTIYRRWRTSFGWDLKQAAKHSQNSTGWRTPQLPADQEHQLPVFCADDQRHQSLWRHKNHSMALYVIDVYGTVCWFVFFSNAMSVQDWKILAFIGWGCPQNTDTLPGRCERKRQGPLTVKPGHRHHAATKQKAWGDLDQFPSERHRLCCTNIVKDSARMWGQMHVYIYIHVCMHVCMYIYIQICVCIYVKNK